MIIDIIVIKPCDTHQDLAYGGLLAIPKTISNVDNDHDNENNVQ
mgnify:FL=1